MNATSFAGTLAFGLLLCTAGACGQASVLGVSKAEQTHWLRWVIPMPKQVRIERKVQVPTSAVRLRLRDSASEVEKAAAEELAALFKDKAGVNIWQTGGTFELLLGVCTAKGILAGISVPGAADLAKLPNSEQAYLICPVGQTRLVLTALDERGVYYAAQTLRQLLEAQFADGKVSIPLATITDWPDLAERGEWGGSAVNDIEWLAAHKMNLVEYHASLKVTEDGKGIASIDPKLIERARLHALKLVPIITHLDQIAGTGIYRLFPELKGKGKSAQHSEGVVAPCFSQPKMAEILGDWFESLAAQKGVSDICIWLSEMPVQCGCENCQKVGQYVLEAQACVRALERARQKYPHIRLRILLTQGSYSTNDKVLAVVPPEVGVTYYHGGLTYNSSRDPMIYPLLTEFAKKGRWLGCYPQLTASWRIVCPWSGPQFIKYRMKEFVDKGLRCLCGYATPNNRLYDFNVTAAAEWSWNSGGRSEREFAAAWATRRGIKNPDQVAEWAALLGPVGWDIYGSGIPYPAFFGRAARLIADKSKPTLGEGMFRYFPTLEHINEDLAACEKSLTIACRLDAPVILAETRVVQGYVKMVKEIYTIAEHISSSDLSAEETKLALQEAMNHLVEASIQTVESLKEWEKVAAPGCGGSRFRDTLQVTEQTAAEVGKALAPLGIQDPGKPHRRHQIGRWESDDFEKEESIQKCWEVTEFIFGTGRYEVDFQYTEGWYGLSIQRVTFASAPKDRPDQLTELSVDDHPGVAAYQNKDNIYTLRLENYDPTRRYFILANIKGVRSKDKPPERQGCCGVVGIKKVIESSPPSALLFEVK